MPPVRFYVLRPSRSRVLNGAELRAVRVAHGLSLAVVAKSLGTFGSYTSKLERGLVHDSDFADHMSASSPISVQSLRPVHPHSAHPSPLTPFLNRRLDSYRSFTAPSKYMAAASPRE